MKQIQRIHQLWSIGKPKRWLNTKDTTRILHRAEYCSTHSTGHYFHGRKLDARGTYPVKAGISERNSSHSRQQGEINSWQYPKVKKNGQRKTGFFNPEKTHSEQARLKIVISTAKNRNGTSWEKGSEIL